MTNAKDKGIIQHLKEYWLIYGFVAQLIINYTATSQTLADHNRRLIELEKKQESEELIITEIRTKLASIETSLIYIKDALK